MNEDNNDEDLYAFDITFEFYGEGDIMGLIDKIQDALNNVTNRRLYDYKYGNIFIKKFDIKKIKRRG